MKQIIKRVIFTMMLGLSSWFAYDVYFKHVINDFQAKQLEKRLKVNHQKSLSEV
jgi:hypothetical protein